MTRSHLAYSVEVVGAGHRVSPVGGSVTLDESWSPYAQASLTIPLPNDPDVLNALDPRVGARVRLTLAQQFGTSFTPQHLTDLVGSSVAGWTADLDGGPLANWTGSHSLPFNASGARPSRVRRLNLGVRSRVVNYERGTVNVDLASDEALLQDFALVATSAALPPTNTVQGVATLALASIGATVVIDGPDVPLEADSTGWEPGRSAWDYVKPLIDTAGMRLYCDETRRWHLTSPLSPTQGALAFSGATATLLEDQLSRDTGWFDAVVIRYRWTDSSGQEQVRYDTAQVGVPTRVYTVEHERRYPGPGAAQAILNRARGRGRVEAVSAVANPEATPGQALTVNLADTPIQTGLITRVTWSLDTDEMQVRSRDLTDTPPMAWALMPPGWAWDAIPMGMSWDELDWHMEVED
ncbi:hypothetical protein [Cellulosimicrobium marinum]|uniref:hypothetical protein n=1 Tax=Cellulosimicrobium marinum TaxID=1638992 RepID=UPI001E293B5B|nr:hypothetical protein [Cellulosimicrobium marinum]MCB7135363.1 hypothetical protein [Cellulosimicrobium marinum]